MGGRSVCGAIMEEGGGEVFGGGAVGGEVEGQDEVFVDAEEGGVGGDGESPTLNMPTIGGNGADKADP